MFIFLFDYKIRKKMVNFFFLPQIQRPIGIENKDVSNNLNNFVYVCTFKFYGIDYCFSISTDILLLCMHDIRY